MSQFKTTIQHSLLEQLFAANRRTLISSTFIAILLAYIERNSFPPRLVITWLSIIMAINLVRYLITRHHQRHASQDIKITSRRLTQFRISVMTTGLFWGMTCALIYTYNDLQHQTFIIFILTGLISAAIVSYSIDIVSAVTYTVLLLTPILIRLLLERNEITFIMAISGILFLVFMLLSIRNINRNFMENIMLRHDAIERENEIKKLAFYDQLTNLPNRRLLLDRLDHALAVSSRSGRRGALLFLDLDHFKLLNDTLGHAMGDLLLKKVAERLMSCVRESDTVARLGGDEFVVMLEDLSGNISVANAQVEKVADLIIKTLNIPYILNTLEHNSTPSIGIAFFGEHGSSQEELLKHADIAMYQAKRAGRNVVRHFDFSMKDVLNPPASQTVII
ncbi:MAG: diguanylate cyclase [Methylotenera sp.]|uniref:GGDEF domain-containing protein n=1 Tax=Methylotenera sp. TaxID=2051956 RepID=UPI00248A08C5|nr:diguanylate cyclase [Methylotenera sp.]MDI1310130.1 diguanylate cyclase [Methylotenera sp.]